VPQAPQLALSVFVFVQAPPQTTSGVVQASAQAPFWQVMPLVVQLRQLAPQCVSLSVVQAPLHMTLPVAQAQTLLVQVSPAAQSVAEEHCTHWLVVVLQTGVPPACGQFAFARHRTQ
jgi:hypothetical protein